MQAVSGASLPLRQRSHAPSNHPGRDLDASLSQLATESCT